jgi:hypothetical protein
MSFTDKNLDILQNIEFAIVEVYRADPALLDHDALEAVRAAIRYYHAEERGHTKPDLYCPGKAQIVFERVKAMLEWRLGRGGPKEVAVPVSSVVESLRSIEKSIRRWNQQGGRRGYLEFVSQFIR